MASSTRPGANRAPSQAQRLPAPSLFIGPPSRNASSTSIISPTGSGVPSARTPLARQRSQRNEWPINEPSDAGPSSATTAVPMGPGVSAAATAAAAAGSKPSATATAAARKEQQTHAEQHSAERTDAIWAEMQNTLEEVELSALSGTRVFRAGHSKALDDLRTAQVALAQAWARSEADEEAHHQEDAAAGGRAEHQKPLGTSNVLASDRDQKLGGASVAAAAAAGRPRSGTDASAKSQLEQDTENDILLARKRREANDRYFQRVNAGVLDVVAKLEEVAKAMKGVEQESKEIWGDGESIETGSFVSK